MANNFEAIIKARLDTSGVENQIKNEINNRQVNLHNVTVNTANLIQQIQEAFSNHTFAINVNSANVQNVVQQMGNIGQSAGQQFAQNFSGEIHRITLNNGGLGDVGNLLHQMGLDQNAINNATQGLQNMVVSIDEIRTRQLSNGNISIRLTGVDELNRGVEVLRVFENETGDIIHSQNQFTQSFGQRRQAVEEFNSSLQRATDALANGDIGAQISKVQQSFSAISGKVDSAQLSEATYQELHNTLLQVETDLEHLNTLEQTFANSGNLTSEQLVAHFNDYESTLNRVRNSLTTVNNTQRQFATSIEVTTLRNQMESWLNKNSRAAKTYGQTVRNLINQLDSATASGNVHKNTLNQLRNSYKEVDSVASAAGLKGKTFGDSLKGAVSSITRYISASTLIYSAIRAVKTGVSDVISLDTALVDLKKTTDASEAELKRFYYTANDVAKQLGVTTEEVISAASSWSRLGYSIQDAEVMAKTSSIFASISPNMGIEEATDGLVSAMKAFNIEADDALDGIASKVNAIGNSQAVSNADIVEFLSKSSAAMKEGNNTLDETIALGTAAQEIVRNASNVGQVLKTTSMRIRGGIIASIFSNKYAVCT